MKTNCPLPLINEEQISLLEELSNACAVSGDEKAVRKIVRKAVKPYVDELRTDALGNLIAVKHAECADSLRVLISAHMDEVGFMVVDKDKEGIFKFRCIGGIDPRALPGKAVLVGNELKPAVIGNCPVHLSSSEDRKRVMKVEELRMDAGPKCEGIEPGQFAYFATRFRRMGDSVCGKALDDRIGVATLIQLLKSVPEHIELTAVFTVQEEVGLRGAAVAAWDRHPDLAIALDSTPAMDLPLWDGKESKIYRTRLGQGAAIYCADHGTLSDPRLIRFFLQAAEIHNIPCQLRQPGGGSTDAASLHLTQNGCPIISVSVPGRYAHTAASMVRISDWQAYLQLLTVVLEELNQDIFKQER